MSYKEAIEEFNSEDENGKSRLVYAYFGLAIYFAQCLEQTFINMIWLDRGFKKRVKFQNEVNEIITNELSNKTDWLVKDFFYDVVKEPDEPNPNTDLTKFTKEIRDNKRKELSNE